MKSAPHSDPNGNKLSIDKPVKFLNPKTIESPDGGSHGRVTEHCTTGGVDDRNPF